MCTLKLGTNYLPALKQHFECNCYTLFMIYTFRCHFCTIGWFSFYIGGANTTTHFNSVFFAVHTYTHMYVRMYLYMYVYHIKSYCSANVNTTLLQHMQKIINVTPP